MSRCDPPRSLLLALLLAGCFAPEQPAMTGRVERFELQSEAVQDTFQLFVRLPPDYDSQPDRVFPLVVQLDANLPTFMEFDVTAGVASTLEARGESPPVIVVGIGYPTAEEAKVSRFRDLALPLENAEFKRAWGQAVPQGEAPRFLQLLREELMPSLASRYRIAGPRGRALFGHSMGGFFVAYALTRHDEAPLFTGYVAASPSFFWDAGHFFTLWSQFDGPAAPALFFTAAGQLEGPEMVVYFDAFTQRAELPGLTFGTEKFQTDHVGSATPSFRAGLRFLAAHGFGAGP